MKQFTRISVLTLPMILAVVALAISQAGATDEWVQNAKCKQDFTRPCLKPCLMTGDPPIWCAHCDGVLYDYICNAGAINNGWECCTFEAATACGQKFAGDCQGEPPYGTCVKTGLTSIGDCVHIDCVHRMIDP